MRSPRLVSIANAKTSVLTSLMVKLNCESAAERWLTPAFVFFFQMLYPFAWVNDPTRHTAAAAGGCMLVRREALGAAGGLEALRGALIDDCALGALMKGQGPIWLGLTEDVHSLRAYPHFADFRRMVVRSAFAELRYSPLRLAGAVAGMALVYLAPPLLAVFARGLPQVAGAFAWAMMALALAPTLRLYRRPRAAGLALPAVAAAYVAFHPRIRDRILARARRLLEGPLPGPGAGGAAGMTDGDRGPLGQDSTRREFPGRLVAFERRAARPDPRLLSLRPRGRRRRRSSLSPPDEKLALLDRLDDALLGRGPPEPDAEPLRLQLRERGLKPRHALDLLDAFRQDVRKSRYADWSELMGYCQLSAAPVGRFVLDVHEEDEGVWPASDALCAALQVINHLQDCAKDYRDLDRVYLPEEVLARHGASAAMLGDSVAPLALRDAIAELGRRTSALASRGRR